MKIETLTNEDETISIRLIPAEAEVLVSELKSTRTPIAKKNKEWIEMELWL